MSQEQALVAGRYRLEELIGRGGMGDVYRGTDTQTSTPVAIKRLHESIVASNPDIVDRFRREGEALRQLDHPNIVKLLDAVEEDGKHYLVMEYVGSGSLRDLIDEESRLPLEAVLNIALDLADALTRAHRLNIIHRDIKPDNVLLDDDSRPLLTDFGVAHLGDRTRLTQTGSVIGTYAYLSPEACNGQELDERTDIWSFGVMLFEMLTGRVPFQESSTAAVLTAILTRPAPDLRRLRPGVPDALADLIHRMLEKDRERRIPSIRLVGVELEAIIRGLDTPLRSLLVGSEEPLPEGSRFATPSDEHHDVPAMARSTPDQTHGLSLYPTPGGATLPPPGATPWGTPVPAGGAAVAPNKWKWIAFTIIVTVLACSGVAIVAILLGPDAGRGETGPESPAPATPLAGVQASQPARDVALVEPVAPGEIMVLVAQLEDLTGIAEVSGVRKHDVTRFVAADLTRVLEEEARGSAIRVRRTPQVITSSQEAQQAAQANGATVVIWGNYAPELIELEIQVGVTDAFPHILFDRQTLEQSANTRVQLTDERRQSAARHVMALLNVLANADGDQYRLMALFAMADSLRVTDAEVVGNTAGAYLHRALSAYLTDTAAAIRHLDEAIASDPGNALAYSYRGLAHLRSGNVAGFATDFETARRLGPPDWPTGLYMTAPQSLEEGIQLYSRIIELRPDDWFPLFLRGITYYYTSYDLDAARADFERSIALQPTANLPYITAMLIAWRQGRMADAQALTRVILTRFPEPELTNRAFEVVYGIAAAENRSGSLFSAGTNLILGQYDQVIEEVRAAVVDLFTQPESPVLLGERVPDLSDLLLLQGLAYCSLYDTEAARSAFGQAIRYSQDFKLAYLLRGQMYRRQLKLDEAETDFRAARDHNLGPEFEAWVRAAINDEWSCSDLFVFEPGAGENR